MAHVSYHQLGEDAYYAGTCMPEGITAEQEQAWNAGWRAADRRERYRLDRACDLG